MNYKVSAIVPAYNEQKKIKSVLTTLVNSKYIHEVICVDDGSTDKTFLIAKAIKGVKVIHRERNKGKAYAISLGIQHATGDITLFIDADINGLTDICIQKLLLPLMNGVSDATIGYRLGKFERLFFRPLGGERAYFKKDLLPYLKQFEKKGYGLEVYLNNLFKKRKVLPVELDITNTWKHEKQSYPTATKLTFTIISQVAREMVRQQARSIVPIFVSIFIFSTLFGLYSLSNAPKEDYKKMIVARVVTPVKESPYFKEMIEQPIKQLESSASGLQHFFD